MSIVIEGISLPKEGERRLYLLVGADGVVDAYDSIDDILPSMGHTVQGGRAEQLQPHGRLIDADTLVEAIKTTQPYYPLILFGTSEGQKAIYIQKIVETINAQPTIIEAEGSDNNG